MTAVCRLTDNEATFSPESASPMCVRPRWEGSGPVQDPANPARTTVAMGATNTTSTTTAKIIHTAARPPRLQNSMSHSPFRLPDIRAKMRR